MKFNEIIELLKSDPDAKAYRMGWNGIQMGKKMYIWMYNTLRGKVVDPFFIFFDGSKDIVGWMPSIWDLMEEDWMMEEESKGSDRKPEVL